MLGSIGPTELILILLIMIPVAMVFYLISLRNILRKCLPDNRAISPGQVWLMLIPLFNIIWHFVIVYSIARTLEREFSAREITVESSPGRSIGMAMCLLIFLAIFPFQVIVPYLWDPYIGLFIRIGALICWIVYWVRISGFSKKLDSRIS
ncbi:MAG: hypothetical protein IMZ47_08500 [Firmicutes bacterium]|nr:hypothetical protein [Bacillota bacterium]